MAEVLLYGVGPEIAVAQAGDSGFPRSVNAETSEAA
jgi:hypothetical protein